MDNKIESLRDLLHEQIQFKGSNLGDILKVSEELDLLIVEYHLNGDGINNRDNK